MYLLLKLLVFSNAIGSNNKDKKDKKNCVVIYIISVENTVTFKSN